MIDAARGPHRPRNLRVSSLWQLCLDELLAREPQNRALYTQTTFAPNPYAVREHIDDIWTEYYLCHYNNDNADQMFGLIQSLNGRGIYAKEYIHQEFEYVRSGLAPFQRSHYEEMERKGRVIPLDRDFRSQVLRGLQGCEQKMAFVGAIDDVGIVTALYRHLADLKPRFRAIPVDEVQDLGTLELAIVRRLVDASENDLFLCGDAAQSVYTKCQDYAAADITLGRHIRLQQNYRNSRQILTAAYGVLKVNLENRSKGFVDLDILDPEFANFSSPNPLLLEAKTLDAEIRYAIGYAKSSVITNGGNKKICIAFCGFSLTAVESLGIQLDLPVLNGSTDLSSAAIFLADLEQTKGFEFDTVIVLNCRSGIFPHPDLPREESYRELCRFYVAMTRAKMELIVSYHGSHSDFIDAEATHFVRGAWSDYATHEEVLEIRIPTQSVSVKFSSPDLILNGHEFLRTPEAVGMSVNLQTELIDHVPGRKGFRDGKQVYWETVDEFISAMRDPRKRHQILSPEAWAAMESHFGQSSGSTSSSLEDASRAHLNSAEGAIKLGKAVAHAIPRRAPRDRRTTITVPKRLATALGKRSKFIARSVCPRCAGNGGHNSNCSKCGGTGWA